MQARNDKLAVARKKLKRFQARNSAVLPKKGSSSSSNEDLPARSTEKMSSTEGLREITNEISSLLSEGKITIIPQHQQNGRQSPPLYHSNNIPTLALPSLDTPTSSSNKINPSLETSSHRSSTPVIGVGLANWDSRDGLVRDASYPSSVSTDTYSTKPFLTGHSDGSKTSPYTGIGLVNHTSLTFQTTTDSSSRPQANAPSLKTDTGVHGMGNGQGLDGHTPINRPIFAVNGVGGSGLSSNVSSQSHSAMSSFSNLQVLSGGGMEYGNRTEDIGMEYGNRTENIGMEYGNRTEDIGREREDLNSQVKAHAQTIDILVSEKSVLQTELTALKSRLSDKTRKCSDVETQLKEFRQKIEEIQRERSTISDEFSKSSKALTQSRSDYRESCDNVDRLRASLEDQQQENTELISKIMSQSAELLKLQSSNTDLQSKLNMAELVAQQLSGGSEVKAPPSSVDPSLVTRLQEVEGEANRLRGNVQQLTLERDQAYSDLTALRDSLVQQQERNAQKMSDVQSSLAESEAMVEALREQLDTFREENENLRQRVTTEHAQMEHSSQAAMETIQTAKDELQSQLENLVKDNAQLTRLNTEQEGRVFELELEMSRLKEQSVDQQSLLSTIAQDKEAVSRAMSQNKELKSNITELQDAFVRLSQQNMELASDLETEKLRVAQLKPHPPITPNVPSQDTSLEGCAQATPTDDTGVIEDSEEILKTTEALQQQSKQIEALQVERSALCDKLAQLQTEHANLSDQFAQLQTSYSNLSDEYQTATHQLESLSQTKAEEKEVEENDFPVTDSPIDVHNMSADELTALQNNFNALQQKFVQLVTEKVELLEKLQENEHLIVQLSHETDTIGDYITLYQSQRVALKAKFQEKDRFIEQLMQEKTSMQGKLHELQALVRHVLSDRATSGLSLDMVPPSHKGPPTHTVTHSAVDGPSSPQSPIPSDLPIHLRQHRSILDDNGAHHLDNLNLEPSTRDLESSHMTHMSLDDSHVTDRSHVKAADISHVTFGESQITVDGDSFVSTATTEQILHLLDELEFNNSQSIDVPCRLCVGPVLYV